MYTQSRKASIGSLTYVRLVTRPSYLVGRIPNDSIQPWLNRKVKDIAEYKIPTNKTAEQKPYSGVLLPRRQKISISILETKSTSSLNQKKIVIKSISNYPTMPTHIRTSTQSVTVHPLPLASPCIPPSNQQQSNTYPKETNSH